MGIQVKYAPLIFIKKVKYIYKTYNKFTLNLIQIKNT